LEGGSILRAGDAFTACLYLVIVIAVGIWSANRARSTEGYFLGGRAMPGWAVGLSMLGTAISSVTFLAYPGSAFLGNWSRIVPGLMLPIATIIGIIFFIPFYRKSNLTSAYEYLENRFGPWGRTYGCALFSLGSVYRMGSILYLLALPLKAMTGWDTTTVIVATGIFVTFYTVLGGIEAVIWTDVMQTIVLFLGGIVTVLVVFMKVPGGAGAVVGQAIAEHKFGINIAFEFDLARDTFIVLALNGLIGNIQEFATDQTKVQRYLAPKTLSGARQAAWWCGLGCIPLWSLFMFVGTCLFVFYNFFPDAMLTGLKSDEIFPRFILTQLPVGVGGFVIAAVLAAAMSSIDSSMNGTATVVTVDVYRRHLVKGKDDHHYLTAARCFTALAGALMIVAALLLAKLGEESSILDIYFKLGAVFAGGLGGLFLLGFFTRRATSRGAAVGIVTAVLVIAWLTISQFDILPHAFRSPTHAFIIGVFGNIAVFSVGLICSYLFKWIFDWPAKENLDGLTWYTRDKEQPPTEG